MRPVRQRFPFDFHKNFAKKTTFCPSRLFGFPERRFFTFGGMDFQKARWVFLSYNHAAVLQKRGSALLR
jgi:hypothetical protein